MEEVVDKDAGSSAGGSGSVGIWWWWCRIEESPCGIGLVNNITGSNVTYGLVVIAGSSGGNHPLLELQTQVRWWWMVEI